MRLVRDVIVGVGEGQSDSRQHFGEYVQLFLSKYFEGEGLLIKSRRAETVFLPTSLLKTFWLLRLLSSEQQSTSRACTRHQTGVLGEA